MRSSPSFSPWFSHAAKMITRLGRRRALAQIWRQQAKRRSAEAGFTDRLMHLEQHLVQRMLEDGRPPTQILHELESALKLDATNDALRRQYADLLIELGRPEQALKQLELLERSQGESAARKPESALTWAVVHPSAAIAFSNRALHDMGFGAGGGGLRARLPGHDAIRRVALRSASMGLKPRRT